VVGVILNLAVWFAVHFLFAATARVARGPLEFDAPVVASASVPALLLAAAAALAIFRLRVSPMLVLALSATAGLALQLVVPQLIG